MSTGPDNPNFPPTPPPPGGYRLGPDPDNYGLANQTAAAQERVQLPAIFLIVVGVLNLLLALYMVFNAFTYGMMSLEQFQQLMEAQEKMMGGLFPDAKAEIAQDPAGFKTMLTVISSIWAGVSLLAALVILMAGIEMRVLRYYGLAIVGSLLACVPCISCTGCCGLGEIMGIWALVVLLNPEVRAAFK